VLAALGFATIAVFLVLTMTRRVSVLVALVAVPVVAAVLGGFSSELGVHVEAGLVKVAPVAVMITFAVLYFTLMTDAGMFDPLIRRIVGWSKGDPVKIALGTALLTLCIALDGDGASTFLVAVSAMLPLYKRIGMSPLVLSGVVALAAGVMNMIPWGGPTARAMAALKLESDDIFRPMLPAMLAGICWVLVASCLLGRRERVRLAAAGLWPVELDRTDGTTADVAVEATPARARRGRGSLAPLLDETDLGVPATRTGRTLADAGTVALALLTPTKQWFNVALTATLLAGLVLELMPLAVLFVLGYIAALMVNAPSWEAQQEQLQKHGGSVALVTTMIFAAGVFTGILSGTKMITEMATAFADVIPATAGPLLAPALAVVSMPLSLVFTPDAFYFGVLPVFGETASSLGVDPALMGRAAILGQMTTGFPLSPLTASTFILVGLSGVDLQSHARHIFKWAFATTLVMTGVGLLTGALV